MHLLRTVSDFKQGFGKKLYVYRLSDTRNKALVGSVKKEMNTNSEFLDSIIDLLTFLGNIKPVISKSSSYFPMCESQIFMSQ